MTTQREHTSGARAFRDDEAFALSLDGEDPLARFRDRFHMPRGANGEALVYLCGNSLGLMPKAARASVEQELDAWAQHAVNAHFESKAPWYSYHELFRESGARLVGTRPGEVVMMNSLTVNLHLMLTSFYQPTAARHKILIEAEPFPSDLYALQTHVRSRGFDPADVIIECGPRAGESAIETGAFESILAQRGGEIALVFVNAVHYLTGQFFDVERIARAARTHGCALGFGLAHAAGNVPLRLHDWDADFAVWCSYKYLNAGPGAIGGCFVHERHARSRNLPRLAGWWGNDPATRFQMRANREFVPREGADGWQLSNPPILAAAPLVASLAIFEEAGMEALRAKSILLTGYLEFLIDRVAASPEAGGRLEIVTPRAPEARGCQLSLRVRGGARELFDALDHRGVVGDFRDPDVIRLAPAPLYNSFHDVWRCARVLAECLKAA
jgi:kynureninase